MEATPKKNGYGKRPLWQWILIYIIIGGIVYFGIYHFSFGGSYTGSYSNSGVSGYSTPTPSSPGGTPTQTMQPSAPVQQSAPQTNSGY